jgi:hypothetical protein
MGGKSKGKVESIAIIVTGVTDIIPYLALGDGLKRRGFQVKIVTHATDSNAILAAGFAFDGSTHVACTMNGTTTGGLIGTTLRFRAISTTVWFVTGVILGSGTIATPAATS